MNRREFLQNASLVVASTKLHPLHAQNLDASRREEWASTFAAPPDAAYPWVYSFWLGGNVTKEGITADLEGMKRAKINGLLFMDGSVGNPPGPLRFMSEDWLEMFHHMLAEAARLGLEVNLNNDPGWAGSGGPWITPEQASQVVVIAQTVAEGGSQFNARLPFPATIRRGYYEDIAVLAYPLPTDGAVPTYRIPDFSSTKSFAGGHDYAGVVPWPRFIPTDPAWPAVAEGQSLSAKGMLDLTSKVDGDGRLTWDVPPGHWMILRFGHTVSNGATRSVQKEAAGLEIDKLSKTSVSAHFDAMVGKLCRLAGPMTGKTLVSTHIDSWEAGSGNWTKGFRDEFRHRRGYDLLAYLPTLDGFVVDSREVSERFLWDFRETVAELMLENYAEHFRELAQSHGLRISIEGYDGTCDDLRYAGRADEPMSEFWRSCYNGLPLSDLNEGMASAAHVYGKKIIGAEAFTAARGDFLNHPATLKPLSDWAFCAGVNRLCFSEWILQPWPNLVPGVSFAIFGTVFHETLTWWPQAGPWHDYLARCQYMLRQGNFVADVCFITPEGAPYRFTPPIPATERGVVPDRPPYNFDGCPAELILNGMTVRNGRVVLPSGMEYRLLVLPTYNAQGKDVVRLMDQDDYFYKPMPMPEVQTMTPALLRRIKELVESGATVLGNRPVKSPSLANFPACDGEIARLADDLWGKGAGHAGSGEHRVGKGRVVWGGAPEEVLNRMGVPADFQGDAASQGKLNYTHRRTDDGSEIYFVVNQQAAPLQAVCSFRVAGMQPELFWPQSGSIRPMRAFEEKAGVTEIPLTLNANESVFVVFRPSNKPAEKLVSGMRDGKVAWPQPAEVLDTSMAVDDSFTMALWVGPGPSLVMPEAIDGGWAYKEKDVVTPGKGSQTSSGPGQGTAGFAIGANGIVVYQFGESGAVQPILVYEAPLTESVQVGIIYSDRIPKLYLNGKLIKTGPTNRFPMRGSSNWADKRPFAGETATLNQFNRLLKSSGIDNPIGAPPPADALPAIDYSHGYLWESGRYEFRTNYRTRGWEISLPDPQEIAGPWQVAFDPKWGGPESILFESLQDWSTHPEPGVRYYSGTATYRKSFQYSRQASQTKSQRLFLDLGKVAVIAEVQLNGHAMGIVWNTPYRIDVTDALQDGTNTLEIQVANTWVNRLIGDEQLPEDCERRANGEVKEWPQWVLEGKQSPTGRLTFVSRRQWQKDDPLVESGLIGPVRVIGAVTIA